MTREQRLRELGRLDPFVSYGNVEMEPYKDGDYVRWSDIEAILNEESEGWLPIESAPKGKPILVHYTNSYGKGRIVKAYYIERFSEEASSESENDEYNEVDDTYYTLPGWYEMIDNWDDYSAVAINSDPTHWMLLPDSPTRPADGGEK
jgi:hypothetical protein